MVSILVGLLAGVAVALGAALWVLGPASPELRRGYFNALVTGLLLAAAIEVIPNALDAVELAGRRLVGLIVPEAAGGAQNFWSVLTQPAQVQIAVRAFGAAIVMFIFFRANAIPLAKTVGPAADGEQPRSALPIDGTDYLGLLVVMGGLAGYALWLGLALPAAQAGRLPASAASSGLDFRLVLLTFIGSLLGIAALGLLQSLREQWWLIVVASLLIGLAAGVGSLWQSGQLALEAGLLPLVVAAVCLVYGIGRLLRLLQHEIGLGWQTTMTVAVGALLLYQSRFIL